MANVASKAFAAYQSAQVETLSQRDLIIRLYQGSERFLTLAHDAMRLKQIQTAHINCVKARDIFAELASTLNFEQGGDIARQLSDIYVFLITRISEANMTKDADKLFSIMPIIVTLREAWEQVPADIANVSSLPEGNDGHAFSCRT